MHDLDLSIVFLSSCKTWWETTGERVLLTFNRVTLLNALTSLYVLKVNTDPSGISYKQVIEMK